MKKKTTTKHRNYYRVNKLKKQQNSKNKKFALKTL